MPSSPKRWLRPARDKDKRRTRRERPRGLDRVPSHQGFFRQRPIAGGVPHLAPSDAPPDGQNTETSVSPASQLTSPSACTERMACPGSPFGPGTPCSPCGPCAPCAPGCPCGPGAPWTPCAPCGPAGPCGPASPFGPGSRPHAASSSATPPTATRIDRLICRPPSPRPLPLEMRANAQARRKVSFICRVAIGLAWQSIRAHACRSWRAQSKVQQTRYHPHANRLRCRQPRETAAR
jgi:hypothetical protein